MASISRSNTINDNPIGSGLDSFRASFRSTQKELEISSPSEAVLYIVTKNSKNLLRNLLLAFQNFPVSHQLPSKFRNATLLDDIDRFTPSITSKAYDVQRTVILFERVVRCAPDEEIWDALYDLVTESTPPPRLPSSILQTPWLRNTSSFANSNEHRKYVDDVLKEELGAMYVGVPGFFEAFFDNDASLKSVAEVVFEKCKKGDSPLYQEESGWQGWPEGAKEKDVLDWFAETTDQFADLAEGYQRNSGLRRRPLAQPHQPLQGSTADRKLDVGFVDDPSASTNSKYHWKQILIPGELKSNPLADTASKAWLDLGRYAREVLAAQDSRRFVLGFTLCGSRMRLWEFDRLGGIASSQFDIHEEGLQFVSAVLGFLWLDEEQLGFDPSIMKTGNSRYIEIERNNKTERLIIEEVIQRAPCIAGRATTCWKAYREGDESRRPLVIKDSWQFPEREEEGELLCEATDKEVANVARYYYHGTVCVGSQDDNIRANVRQGLDITKATNYMPESTMPPPSRTGRRVSRKSRSSSAAAGQKRSSSCTDVSLPPSKRTCSSSPVKGGNVTVDRVHRRVVVQDYGKPIYEASSRVSLLAALEGCIDGYESLHTQAGMLQRDISPNNLMVNEDDDNPSWRAFLIDLDLAVKEQRETSSGARGKTGTRAFMAIGVLLDDKNHSFMHDLESFFWVLFWICVHYEGPGKSIGATEFECWNYESDQKLAELKLGLVSGERHFISRITKAFTPHYRPLVPHVNRLRRVIFPMNNPWENEDRELYVQMKKILQNAQVDPEVLER